MNKHCFRLIFSKSLGFLIPVAETTRAQRKPGQTSSSVASTSSTSPFFSLKRLAASLLLTGLPGWAFAELVVDPAGGRETNVISAPNGLPVIEIANPNGKGLSHNRFTEFDVVKPGVIFNNSQANGVSQLGGAILGNPNLQRQATAILSEVTGNKPSSISGTLEVFGGRADILIANPNGLSVNGVTTLNSSSLTLSTGRPQEVGGQLQLLVDQDSGQVVIGAEGVNTEGLSYFDIVARSVALQGAVGSKAQQTDIQIAAGQGTYDPLTGTFTAKPGAVGSGLAISGSAAGAMYGRYINLISSDSGAGVRHEGLILAAGDIHLSAAGDIELKDVGANGRVDISTTATLTNTGTVAAGKTLSVTAQDLINRKGGYLGSDGDLSIHALGQLLNEQGATLLATGAMALSADQGFTNAGGIQSGGALQISTDGTLSNSGMVRSTGLTIKAGSLSNEQGGVLLSNTDASFTVKGDLTNRSGAGIYAQQKLTFDVTGAVLNNAATLAANSLVISAGSLTNQAAAKVLADAGLDLDIKNAVLNDNAVLAAKTLTVKAASLSNQNAAKLVADQSVTLNVVGAVVNNASTLASGNLLSIKSASLDNASSAILAGTTVTLDAADIRNRDSAKLQGTDVSLTASTRFSNESSASLQASNTLTLDTDTLTVTGGELLAGNDLSLTVGTYKNTGLISSLNTASLSFKNNANLVIDAAFKGPQAANLFTLNAHDVTVTGELNSPGSVLIKATGDVRNQGTVIVGKSLGIEAKGLIDNAPGKLIWAGKNLYLDAGTVLTNGRDSLLMAMGDIALSAGQKVQNNTGRIEAQGDLSIDTLLLENLSSAEGGVSEDSQVKSDTRYTDTYRVFELQYYRVQVSLPTYKSTLSVQQGVVKAGGDLLLNQGTSKGKKATVRNVGGLMAATGNVLIDGNVENRGVSASKSLVDILRAAQTEWRWSNSNGVIYPDGDWVQGTLYSFLDEYLTAGAESRWIKSLKKTSTPGLEQVLSAVLGADWKALEQDTLVQRWADFKANGSDKTQPYYADTQAEISAGQTFLQTGGTFENGDGSNWKEQTPITVKVGSKTVDSLAGELDAQFNLTHDGATDLLKQQLGSPLFQKRESSGDGQAFERVKPLYETRVKYLDQSQFLGSQYFLDKIGYDPQKSVTVLGDAYFDHQLIVQSVEQRVGNFYAQTQRLGGTALVKMLLDNGAALAATEGVSFGQPLTAAQVEALTSDVVWYENQVIDGQTVLAPKLYLSQKTLAARAQDAASSALVSADTVLIDADSVTNFNGTVRGNTDTFVYSKGDINNISLGGAQAGFFAGNGGADGKGPAGQLVIAAEGLVRNQGGVMSGFQQTLVGGKGILSSATTGYDETGALVVRDNGRLGMGLTPDAEKPAEKKPKEETPAADPVAQTPPAEKQPLKVEAPKVRDIFEAKLAEGPVDTSQGSSLSLISGGDITLTSAITQADNVLLQTTGNVSLNDLHEARSAYAASHTQGFLSSVNVEERAASANSVGNVLTAKNLTIQAQKDLNITGGEINAQNSDIRVGGNSKVVAGKDLAFYEKAVTTKQLVIGAGVGAGGYEATGLWGTAPQESGTLSPSTVATASTGSAGSGSVRGDVNVGRAAASQELAKAGSTGATSGANKGRGGTNGANFKIGYEEVTTTDSTESVNYRNAQLNLGSGSVDVGGSLDIGGADINAGYQLSPEARAKMTPEQRAEASKNMPTLAISAGDIKTTKYEDSETTKHTREEFFAGYTAEAHSSVLDVAGNASNLAHKALGKDVVNDPDAPKGSSKTLANEQKAMEVDPALTALAAAGMATQLAFGEAAGVSSTYGIQHTQEEKETSSRSENINQIGGNISLTSTKGDIELNGVNLQGGKVAIKSAGNLTQRAAKSSTTSSESVQTHTAGLTSSAGVSPTGVGTGISVGASGNYDKTESSSTSYTNGLISGTEVSIETKGDHNLIGSNIKGNQVALKIGGNQTITSVQDTSKTDHTRGNWSTSVGVAITTDGLIVPTASASGSGGKDYDDSQLVAEQAGIDADSLDLKVAGNLDLTGAHIVSKPGQGTVKVDGKITANTLHDSREKDGGYGGGGGGISKNGLPTATLEGGRVDQVHYQADNTATIDVGDPSKVTAGNGMDGKLNTDASKQLNVTENRRVAGTDIKVEISIGDAQEIKAGVKKAFSPKAPKVHLADAPTSRTPTSQKATDVDAPKATPRSYADSDTPAPAIKAKQIFDQHVIVTTDSQNLVVKNAVDNLVAKHPDKSVVVKANADGTITPIQGELKPGTAKYEVVGHGDGQSLGGLDGKQISDVVQKLAKDSNTSIDKLALVGCGTACSKDGKSLVNEVNNRLLEGGTNTQVKGYDGAVAVDEHGHKQAVKPGAQDALGKDDPQQPHPAEQGAVGGVTEQSQEKGSLENQMTELAVSRLQAPEDLIKSAQVTDETKEFLNKVKDSVSEQLKTGMVFLGETHYLPDAKLLINQLILEGKVNRVFLERPPVDIVYKEGQWLEGQVNRAGVSTDEYIDQSYPAADGVSFKKHALWYEQAKPVIEQLKSRGWLSIDDYFSNASTANKESDLHEMAGDVMVKGAQLYVKNDGSLSDVMSLAIGKNVKLSLIDGKAKRGGGVQPGEIVDARNKFMADIIKSRPEHMDSGAVALFGSEHLKSWLSSKGERVKSMQELLGLPAERAYDLSPRFVDYETKEKYFSFKEQAGVPYSAVSKLAPFKAKSITAEDGENLISYKFLKNQSHVVVNTAGSEAGGEIERIKSKHPDTTVVFENEFGTYLQYRSGRIRSGADFPAKVYVLRNKDGSTADSTSLLARLASKLNRSSEGFTLDERYVSPEKTPSQTEQAVPHPQAPENLIESAKISDGTKEFLNKVKDRASEQLKTGMVVFGETHELPDSKLLVNQLILEGKVNRVFLENPPLDYFINQAQWLEGEVSRAGVSMDEFIDRDFPGENGVEVKKHARWYERAKPVIEQLQSQEGLSIDDYFASASAANKESDLHKAARDVLVEGAELYSVRGDFSAITSLAIDKNVKLSLIDGVPSMERDALRGEKVESRNKLMADIIKSRPEHMAAGAVAVFGSEHLKRGLNSKAERTQSIQEMLGLPAERAYDLSPSFVDFETKVPHFSFKEQAGVPYSAVSKIAPFKATSVTTEDGKSLIAYKLLKNNAHVVVNAAGEEAAGEIERIRSKHPDTTMVFSNDFWTYMQYKSGRILPGAGAPTKVYVLRNKEVSADHSASLLARLAKKLGRRREEFTVDERYVSPSKALDQTGQEKAVE